MTRKAWFNLLVVCGLLLVLTGSVAAQGPAPQGEMSVQAALGTAFSYQGYLEDGGVPVNGTCDLKFGLYTAASGGSMVGSLLTKTGVTVTDGTFTEQLDFGASAFGGSARWLRVQVRCPSGSGSYTTLIPRQELTPAPYALYASKVGAHDHWGESWSGSDTGLTLSGGSTGVDASGTIVGVKGRSDSSYGLGVYGYASATSSITYGVYGYADSSAGRGVYGYASATSGTTYGVYGYAASSAGRGVYGAATSTSGTTYGVYGYAASSAGRGVYGYATSTSGTTYGVSGYAASTYGRGVYGYASATSGSTYGVEGLSASTYGVGVYGYATATSGTTYGVYGRSYSTSGRGVYGLATSTSGITYGVYGRSASTNGYAGYFSGKVRVNGTLSKSAGSFKIDHPLDPAHKYLYHSFVESPDMMNVYNGNVTLDGEGTAWVQLPEWFEALNQDFRYQLTCIGGFAPVYIAQKIQGNRFQIAGGEAGMEVSWQVTGIRHDAYAEAHRIPVEEEKPAGEQGTYLHAVEQGQPKELGLDYQRNTEREMRNEE